MCLENGLQVVWSPTPLGISLCQRSGANSPGETRGGLAGSWRPAGGGSAGLWRTLDPKSRWTGGHSRGSGGHLRTLAENGPLHPCVEIGGHGRPLFVASCGALVHSPYSGCCKMRHRRPGRSKLGARSCRRNPGESRVTHLGIHPENLVSPIFGFSPFFGRVTHLVSPITHS